MPANTAIADVLERNGYTSIPLTRSKVGHLQCDARINGTVARLIVDTGASATVVDAASAKTLGLEVTPSSQAAVGCLVPGALGTATLERLQVASLDLEHVDVAVLDLSHVNNALEHKGAGRVDGILGADVMDGREAVIEYAQRTLHLRR